MGDGPIQVVWSKADQMFNDILKCCNTDRMPRYKGDLELINHSAGSITSAGISEALDAQERIAG